MSRPARARRTRLATCAACLAAIGMLCGCGLADLGLWLGKWEDAGRSVDFRMERFVLTDSFAGGNVRITGRYSIDPNKFPKRVDFTPEEISVSFAQDDPKVVVHHPGDAEGAIDDTLNRVRLSSAFPEDAAALRLITVFLASLPLRQELPGVYRIVTQSGTYLELELNLPDDGRPPDYGLGYAQRTY